jgi:hypothetical protein
MVCVRFLRTQQCVKSQCLLVLDRAASFGGCLVLDSFGKMNDSCRDCFRFRFGSSFAGVVVWTLTESLILAQDERWRRA